MEEARIRYEMLYKRASICENVNVINKDGYYLGSNILYSFDLDYIHTALSDWENINQGDFNEKLKSVIDKSLGYIEKNAIDLLPKRRKILECIFNLYKEANYVALIPLVLSQIDGIAKQITNGKSGFYNVENKVSKFAGNVQYVHFATNAMQLNKDNKNNYELLKEMGNTSEFNRHAILHGESTEFGTEKNAVKAIALLQFVCELLNANY